MKLRTGFVSNSSSSSFIVGFKKRPQSVEEVHELLFGKEPSVIEVYNYGLPTMVAAEQVFNDIQKQQPATETQIKEDAGHGYFPGYPSYDYNADEPSRILEKEFNTKFPKEHIYDAPEKLSCDEARELGRRIREARELEWDAEEKLRQEALDKYVKSILSKYAGLEVYLFEYADDGGQCVMEHGDIFHNLPHEQISRH